MPTIAGFTATGRKLIGPASDLYELKGADDLKHTAIIFHPEWANHPAITDALSVIQGYLESPLVTGLVELVNHFPEHGAFLYPTGKVWSVAEIVQALADRGERGGIRAGLELMYTAGQILTEGSEAGEAQGVYSHGGLTPRRIVVKSDGQVMVIGYGLPQVEILEYHADRRQVPREDSFRYCPPERLEARPEDVTSDIFGLCLIAFELMTGKPVYDGLVNDIRQQAARGEGSRRLFRFREVLPEPVRNLLTKALRPDPASRYLNGEDFLGDVHALLSDRNVVGPSLLDLMEELQSERRRVGGVMQQGRTQMVSADDLRDQLEQEEQALKESIGRSTSDVWRPANRKRIAPRGRSSGRSMEEQEQVVSKPEVGSSPKATELPPSAADNSIAQAVSTTESHSQEDPAADGVWSKATRRVRRVRRSTESLPAPESLDSVPPEPELQRPSNGRRVARTTPTRPAASVPDPPMIPTVSLDLPLPEEDEPTNEGSASLPPPVIPAVAPNPPTADDLLLQIRGDITDDKPIKLSNEATAVFSKEDAVEVIVENSDDTDSATVMMTPDQLRAKLAAEVDGTPPSTIKREGRRETKLGTVSVQLVLPRGVTVKENVPADLNSAGAVTFLMGRIIPLPIDQSGTLHSWYRFVQAGQRIESSRMVSDICSEPIEIVAISADTRLVEVTVVSSGQDVRFSNPMSTVVPVYSLTAHLQDWLALPSAEWEMVFDGNVLDSNMILDDLPDSDGLAITLRIAES